MTPAVDILKQSTAPFQLHEYESDGADIAFGEEAAAKMGVGANRVFKTLVVSLNNGSLAVAVVPVARMLNLKALVKALSVKKAVMADPALVERTTGYVLGGVSPIGQKKRLPTVVDESAALFDTIFVSGGRRGLEIEIAPEDLRAFVSGRFEAISSGDM